MRAILAFVAALVTCGWAWLTPAIGAASSEAESVSTYTYDMPIYDVSAKDSTNERGPPTGDETRSTYDAVDRWSYGTLACLDASSTTSTTVYADPAMHAETVAATTTTGGQVVLADGDLSSPQRSAVAANAERRVFSNLAPGDAVRQAGFRAISPTSLKGVSGRYNYVVGTDGRLVIGNRRFGHIDLANGGDVLAAGEFRIVQGQVRSINNASGHYRPVGSSAQSAAEQAFGSSGLTVRSGAYTEIVP